MNTYANTPKDSSAQLKTDSFSKKQDKNSSFQLMDARPQADIHSQMQESADSNAESSAVAQMQAIADASPSPIIQQKENNTGMPDNLKSGIENLSGYAMDDVNVHYNSDKPAGLQAHAYAQGSDIHIAPGQEKHLPHEAWHVVQQKQGRVQPTMQMKGKVAINDDNGLESEADVMGAKALQMKEEPTSERKETQLSDAMPVQRVYNAEDYYLAGDKKRDMYVEGGGYTADNDEDLDEKADRAVLHETMVLANKGEALATRFGSAAIAIGNGANAIGLTVTINSNYQKDSEIAGKQADLTAKAKAMEKTANVNVVRVLWQDGRKNPESEKIRSEVPFAELRKNAALDAGSQNLFKNLETQANTVWRKMGDDDMPFDNPNNNELEINKKLKTFEPQKPPAEEEDDAAVEPIAEAVDGPVAAAVQPVDGEDEAVPVVETDKGAMVSFSYNLVPENATADVREICTELYKREASTIDSVKKEFGIPVYAIEPTTYYRGPAGEDGGKEWENYDEHVDSHNQQIKEGASFAKALHKKHTVKREYVPLPVPMPTAAGGRLDKVVVILNKYIAGHDITKLKAEIGPELKKVDQSIWDGETLTRGAKWMCRSEAEKNIIDGLTPRINVVINAEFLNLLTWIEGEIATIKTRLVAEAAAAVAVVQAPKPKAGKETAKADKSANAAKKAAKEEAQVAKDAAKRAANAKKVIETATTSAGNSGGKGKGGKRR
jgi:hypothetical protein